LATKNFAAATKRFLDRTKHFVVVTKYFCYPYFDKLFCWYNKTFFSFFSQERPIRLSLETVVGTLIFIPKIVKPPPLLSL